MDATRVFVIGLDGATFDLLDPWVKEGRLPNLKRMMESSTYGRLESTIPPVTPPAWTSFTTGVNPGKHGVFDFITFKPNSYEKVLVNSNHVRSKRFWDLAGEKGKKSIILYVPLTYPPEKVEGVMISGIPTPAQGEFIYPTEMEGELEGKLGRWRAETNGDKLGDFHEETFLTEIYQTLETRFRVAKYLMTREWDLFILVIMETDWMQHFLWGEKDRCLLPLYMKIDEMIGGFRELLRDEDVILVLSDHGFGPVRKTFYMNVWLREKGFLVSRRQWGATSSLLKNSILYCDLHCTC
jgi:predicted AlkP superfamily phosphohydrolase/phosphomutase